MEPFLKFYFSFGRLFHTKGWHLGFSPSCHSFVTIAHIRFSHMRLTLGGEKGFLFYVGFG